jgi:serine/threonine protein kinase/Tol biopolymer transport system component
MGEVYRARDTRLDRIVALKVLPQAFSTDPDRLQRFQYEARILSTLNHPNVMAIHDVGEQDGIRYLVSEFLDGQTLRERMAGGPLPRYRIIEYALEIAKGLAAAHDKGIIHRDLKPDNIFVMRDDRVKILDFGLAKQAPTNASDTVTAGVPTTPGTVMGTVGYMSPEQVRGLAVDHRSDIFSFGAILYEMVSGKRAFRGDSSVETMNAILKEDVPELSTSSANISPGLERIVRRCLEKLPERRFQSASDLAFALEALSGTTSTPQVTLSGPAPAIGKSRIPWIVAGVAAAALIAAAAWFLTRPRSFAGEFTQITFRSAYIRSARFAPGKTVVYGAAINGEPQQLFSTRTDTYETQPLNLKADLLSVSSASDMALSLDRDFAVTWTPIGRLARAPLGGGSTRELLDDVIDADWTPDGSQLAVSRLVHGKFRLEFPIGKVLYETWGYISDLRFSPSGKQIAFLDHPIYGDDRGNVAVVDLEGHRKALTEEFGSEQGLAWSPDGDEIWFTASRSSEQNRLFAVTLRGQIRVVQSGPVRLHLQDIAKDGTVLLSSELLRWQIGLADTATNHLRDLTVFQWPVIEAISRDGGMMLMNSFDLTGGSNYRLYIQRADGSAPVFVGMGVGMGFSSDEKWAATIDPSHTDQFTAIPIGIGEPQKTRAPAGFHYVGTTFLPDGKRLLITIVGNEGAPRSGIQDIATGEFHPLGQPGQYVATNIGLMVPGPSPDGKDCILIDDANRRWLQPLDGSSQREIKGISPGEMVVQWHNDSSHVFVAHSIGSDTEIYDLNLANGQRKLWTKFVPPDRTAMIGHSWLLITPDGSKYGYMSQRIYSTLFLASGLK